MTDSDRDEFRALGTGVVLVVTDAVELSAARRAVDAELDLVDRTCSRFRADSELEALNRAGGRRVAVGPLLLEAIGVALRAAQLTDGDLDPTIGQALRVLGYDRDFSEIGDQRGGVLTLQRIVGWRHIDVDHDRGTVRIPDGVTLDLGATAKAWAADRAAAAAAGAISGGVLVSIGGDIATAGPAPAEGWLVRVADSHASALDEPGQTVTISGGGLATSSTTVRRWARGGRDLHHIIDPATGLPAEEVWRTVSVAAATCLDANIASTTSVIRGERAPTWLSGLGLPARLVRRDGGVTVVNGWPDGEDRP